MDPTVDSRIKISHYFSPNLKFGQLHTTHQLSNAMTHIYFSWVKSRKERSHESKVVGLQTYRLQWCVQLGCLHDPGAFLPTQITLGQNQTTKNL
jgi:hypothetical protein